MLALNFMNEVQHEMVSTRKMLERLPQDKLDWKPHDKSMTLGQLASHVAEGPGYMLKALSGDGFNFDSTYKPAWFHNTNEIVAFLDKNLAAAVALLKDMPDDAMKQNWTLSVSGNVIFSIPRIAALRSFGMSHMIHHRGQLSVYLRMLDVLVPSIYGPSADEAA